MRSASDAKLPFRAQKTHELNERALKRLRTMFENAKLAELTAADEFVTQLLRQGDAKVFKKTRG